MNAILTLHLVSTLFLVGLIWFVQIVHYPLMADVGSEAFTEYEPRHTRLTTYVVAPAMLTELVTSVVVAWMFRDFDFDHSVMSLIGLLLVGVVWGVTWLCSVPAHRQLERGFDESVHRKLVVTNWIRTIAWSARGVLTVMWFLPVAGVAP